ncbi:MAG: UbiX family flavin prenyltransferase [Halanaerobiales bacterium]
MMRRIITALTGASGSIYAKRLVEILNQNGYYQYLMISHPAADVLKFELEMDLEQERGILDYRKSVHSLEEIFISNWDLSNPDLISCPDIDQYNSIIASGSSDVDTMVVIPCSMGSIARFSQGFSSNLIERSFDVMLKERRKIVLVPRETPLNTIHLRNLLSLSEMDVDIIPAMPAFYHKPGSIQELVDFIVGRVLEHLGVKHTLYKKWEGHSDK